MNAFHVWLRPLGDSCRVRVDGIESGKWLLDRLSRTVVVKTSAPSGELEGVWGCSFEVLHDPPLSRFKFERLLAAIPEVILMTGPECDTAGKAGAVMRC